MAAAAAALVSIERSMLQVAGDGADPAALATKQVRCGDAQVLRPQLGRAVTHRRWTRARAAGGALAAWHAGARLAWGGRSAHPPPAHGPPLAHLAALCSPRRPQAERSEAASLLERRLAAMEALLTARRQSAAAAAAAAVVEKEPELPSFMQPPPTVRGAGPGSSRGGRVAE